MSLSCAVGYAQSEEAVPFSDQKWSIQCFADHLRVRDEGQGSVVQVQVGVHGD